MNRTRKTILVLALSASVLVSVLFLGCGQMRPPWEGKGGPPRVLVTFAPLASWARAIGGDRAGVMSLCEGTGPHDYQFTIEDALKLRDADLFVANGLGLDDHFADKLNANSGNPKLRFSKLTDALPKNERRENPNFVPGQEHKHVAGEECDCAHGPYDPHAWLGLPQAIEMVRQLCKDFKAVDSAHAAEYDKNADKLIKELEQLLAEGKERLKNLKAPLITSHSSMNYFADSFGLKILGANRGLDGQQADNQKISNLLKASEPYDRVILAVEPQYRKDFAENLKSELAKQNKQCDLVVLDPLETSTEPDVSADWYVNKMRANIEALAKVAR